MSLLTRGAIIEHIETDLPSNALDRFLNDAEAEIIARFGPHGDSENPITEDCEGGEEFIFLSRPYDALTSVTERESEEDTVLSSDDYRAYYGNRALKRQSSGTNSRILWAEEVRVVYRADDTDRRKRVQMDLVKLAIQYSGLKSQNSGNYSETQVDYEAEKNKILNRLAQGKVVT